MKIASINEDKIIIQKTKNLELNNRTGAIIKTLGCGLCGSDIVKLKHKLAQNGSVLGHEIVGEIIDIKSQTDFKIGDKIASSHHIPCFNCKYCKNENFSMCEHFKKTNIIPGGFSEYIYLSEEHLKNVAVKIPTSLSEIEASFYEPLGCCIRAIKRSGECKNNKVLVIGLGSIGLLMGQALKAYGADVYGCDIIKDRIEIANKLGIKSSDSTEVLNLEADKIFMTSGADATIDLALKSVRDGGKIIVFASTPKNFGYANNQIYYRELTIMGSYSPAPIDLKDSMGLLTSGKINVKNISTIYDFNDIDKAFRDTINNTILKAYIKIAKE